MLFYTFLRVFAIYLSLHFAYHLFYPAEPRITEQVLQTRQDTLQSLKNAEARYRHEIDLITARDPDFIEELLRKLFNYSEEMDRIIILPKI